jgi:hypothetical protein
MRGSYAKPDEEACRVSPKAMAVAGLSAIAIAASGCSGGSDDEGENPIGFPKLTTTWMSPTYGYSFKHEEGRGPTPAAELWDPVIDPPVDTSGRYDDPFDLLETGHAAFVKSASTPIPEGVSIDEWVDEHVSGCGGPRSQQAEVTIDGQSGRIAECPRTTPAGVDRIEATVVAGGRLYLFILLRDSGDYREVFDYVASTIELHPETAAEAESAPATTTEQPPAVDISGLRAAFKQRFGTPSNETPWSRLVTGLKVAPEAIVTEANTYARLEVETKLDPGSHYKGGLCGAIYGLAREFMEEDAGLAVALIASDGTELGGCA